MTPAEELHEAARLMRERAEAASPGPWFSWLEGRDGWGGDSFVGTKGDADLYVTVSGHHHPRWEADQDYIAGMHPDVALAVADWLGYEARHAGAGDPGGIEEVGNLPLMVARAFLGQQDEAS